MEAKQAMKLLDILERLRQTKGGKSSRRILRNQEGIGWVEHTPGPIEICSPTINPSNTLSHRKDGCVEKIALFSG
jgi:hypothetical protein